MVECVCNRCAHSNVCSLKKDYIEVLNALNNISIKDEFHISMTCSELFFGERKKLYE